MSIIYLDTSALIKLYIQEEQSSEVSALVDRADGVGASILAYTEMVSAMARAVRMRLITDNDAGSAWENFIHDWPAYTRLNISSQLTERAASLAWDYGLRGFDAVHLAAALTWQETLELPVCLATFDRLLWDAGGKTGIATWPEKLAAE